MGKSQEFTGRDAPVEVSSDWSGSVQPDVSVDLRHKPSGSQGCSTSELVGAWQQATPASSSRKAGVVSGDGSTVEACAPENGKLVIRHRI